MRLMGPGGSRVQPRGVTPTIEMDGVTDAVSRTTPSEKTMLR